MCTKNVLNAEGNFVTINLSASWWKSGYFWVTPEIRFFKLGRSLKPLFINTRKFICVMKILSSFEICIIYWHKYKKRTVTRIILTTFHFDPVSPVRLWPMQWASKTIGGNMAFFVYLHLLLCNILVFLCYAHNTNRFHDPSKACIGLKWRKTPWPKNSLRPWGGEHLFAAQRLTTQRNSRRSIKLSCFLLPFLAL